MKFCAVFILLLACLAFPACKNQQAERVARLKAIQAEIEAIPPGQLNSLVEKALKDGKPTEERMKSITVTLPSGITPTLKEVFDASILSIVGHDNPNAGSWEDDPKNWRRAFGEELPDGVSVIHSSYWESNHFTREYQYYFEVQASPAWKDAFLKKRGVVLVEPSAAWSFRAINHSDNIPKWYVPDPVEQYEVWDLPEYHGSIFINQSNGHIHFQGGQL